MEGKMFYMKTMGLIAGISPESTLIWSALLASAEGGGRADSMQQGNKPSRLKTSIFPASCAVFAPNWQRLGLPKHFYLRFLPVTD
jgi:hypothetical protein